MTTVQEQYQELCKLDPRIDDRIFIKSLNIVDRNKKEVISYLHGTSEPSPEFLKSWNNTIYPGYKNKLDNYPKISELYILIDDIIKDKGELYRKLLKQASGLDDILELAMQLHEKADYYDMYDIIKGNRIIGNALVYAKSKYIYNEFLKRDESISDMVFLRLIGMSEKASQEFRKSKNLTQNDLATYLNVDQTTISKYEIGKEIISTVFKTPLFVNASNWVLETHRICRVTSNRYINFFVFHNGNAFWHVISSVYLNIGSLSI